MMRFLTGGDPVPVSSLGPLELQLLQTLWVLAADGDPALARDVLDALEQPLAYTTVTTTLDRLCKKNLVTRSKVDRAYAYLPKYNQSDLQELEARRAIRPLASAHQLISSLIDTLEPEDPAVLDELEEKIKQKRESLKKGRTQS